MHTTTDIRRAARQLQERLDTVREKEVLHHNIASLIALMFVSGVVAVYVFAFRPYPFAAPEWLPPVEIGTFALLLIVSVLGGGELYMRLCRHFSKAARVEYRELCELIVQEPYRSIAAHIRSGTFRYKRDHWDDPRNLEYASILCRA